MEEIEYSWEDGLIDSNHSILQVMKLLSDTSLQIAMVVDADRRLVGIVCDGDIRRGILKGVSVSDSIQVDSIINLKPFTVEHGATEAEILKIFEEAKITRLPILDSAGVVVGLAKLEDFLTEPQKTNPVVVMAGGKGSRLLPLTETTPKPMLPVGGRPMLETILESFRVHGFSNFYFCVNYLSPVIREYFGDGSRWNVSIQYIEEGQPLGTAGALKLLPDISEPAIITNADILTKLNFTDLLSHHSAKQVMATMCVKEYEHKIPYGVIHTRDEHIVSLEEKPVYRFFVNAGIYVVNPELLKEIPSEKIYNITEMFDTIIQKHAPDTTVFPVHEYWLDIGRMSDYEKAQADYDRLFR